MTRRILTRETFDRQPGVGEVQSHDPRLRFAAIFNTLSPIVGVSSAKPLVLGGGSVLQPGHYGMGVFNPSNANIGAGSSSSDVRFNSTLSDLAVVLAVNWLHGGYTERSMTLLNLSGGNYIPSITMNSYYSTIDGRFAEGYSGTTLSGSFAKSVPGVVVFRRIGTALTLECRSATGAYGRYTATDTKRSVPELGAGGVGIGGGNAVAAAYIIEGSVGDDEALALLSNPWRVFKGRRLFVGGWAAGGGGTVTVTGDKSTQSNSATSGSIGQAHAITGGKSTQSNSATSAALSQSHATAGSSAQQSNAASSGAAAQTHAVAGASAAQANTCSSAAIGQSSTVNAALATQPNIANASAVVQAHTVLGGPTTQPNTASSAALLNAGTITLGAGSSTQQNAATVAAITQAHLVTVSASVQDNIASASAVVQGHLLSAATSNQLNIAGSAAVVQQHGLSGLSAAQVNRASVAALAEAVVSAALVSDARFIATHHPRNFTSATHAPRNFWAGK